MALKVGKKKTISSDFVHRWRGGAKCLTSKGGFGRTPRTPPGSAPDVAAHKKLTFPSALSKQCSVV